MSSPKRGPLFTPLPASPERDSAATADTKVAPSFAKKVVRNKAQIKVAKPEVTREARLRFTTKERQNFIEKVITGKSDKLAMIDYGKMMDATAAHDDVFAVNETIENFVSYAAKHFIRFDIIEFMKKFPWLEERGAVPEEDRFDGKTIDLFEQWDQIGRGKVITLKRIADTTVWMKTYLTEGPTSESFLDDLDWQHKYLLDCMDATLLDSVLGELKNEFSEESHGGPLTFAVMIEKCINLSPGAINALRTDFVNFSLASIPGENVDLACRRLLYALKRLENNGALPHDTLEILFKIFKTCSVPDFLIFVSHWEQNLYHVDPHELPSYREFLASMKKKYTTMCIANKWTGVKEQGSVFNAAKKTDDGAPNIWRNPSDLDKISSSPLRYQREIKGRIMKYCEKCFRHGTREKGRWNTTHFTDEHGQGRPTQATTQAMTVSPANSQADAVKEIDKPLVNKAGPAEDRKTLLINQLIAEFAAAKNE